MAAVLVAGIGLTSASASTTHPYPAALGAFSPNGVVPGRWHLVRRTRVVYLTSGLLAGCHSAGAGWQRPDGTWLMLFWAACGKQKINLLSATYAVTRSRSPVAFRDLSVLGANVDLVGAGPDGQILRYWLQGDLRLTLVSICPQQGLRACASLTAPAAHYMAARLPGRPIETKATSVFPPASGLLSAFILLWLLFVGGNRMRRRAKLEKFQMVPHSKRLYPVDQEANDLRKVSRRRWWGKLFIIIGVVLAIGVGGIAGRLPAQAVGYGVVSLLLAGAGLAMLRHYRRPLLTHERYHRRRSVAKAFHIRRLFSVGLTLLLGLLSLLIPLVVLAGWALAGLASAEQDLSSILAGLVIAAVVACYFVDRAAQRLRTRNLQEAMKRDPDRSMLYLRNFGDDDQKITTSRFNRRGVWQRCTGWLNPIGSARFEEVLTRALAHSGPIVAVGQPGGKLHNLFSAIAPTLGAAKTTLSQDDWQDQVRQLATDARAVVVSATPAQINPGFAWELYTLAKDIKHGRIILVLGTGTKAALHHRFSAFLKTVATYPLFQDLASGWISDGVLILVHVPADGWGTWRGWGAEHRTAWTYTAAISAAMAYAEKAWAGPPAKLIPPPEGIPVWEGLPLREGAPTGQQETGGRLTGTRLTTLPPTETMLAETVERALHTAADEARRRAQPIDTRTLLVALMEADQAGRWDRICLNSRSREAIKQADYYDPLLPPCQWNNVTLTRACAAAFETAWRLSLQYRQTPLQLGILVLGLIADESSAASRALNIDDQGRQTMMAQLVQEDLIGTNLIGLHLGSACRTVVRSGVPRGSVRTSRRPGTGHPRR
jgi:hypothetical protein